MHRVGFSYDFGCVTRTLHPHIGLHIAHPCVLVPLKQVSKALEGRLTILVCGSRAKSSTSLNSSAIDNTMIRDSFLPSPSTGSRLLWQVAGTRGHAQLKETRSRGFSGQRRARKCALMAPLRSSYCGDRQCYHSMHTRVIAQAKFSLFYVCIHRTAFWIPQMAAVRRPIALAFCNNCGFHQDTGYDLRIRQCTKLLTFREN